MTDPGTTEVDVPRALQEKSCLEDEQIRAVADLALMLECTVGRAVDVECAFAEGVLYLLQCRPITGLQQ
jgi:pyruvate,water dikinase